jgi:hypothetical protein
MYSLTVHTISLLPSKNTVSPPKPHLRPAILPQPPQENMIPNPTRPIPQRENLRQPHLPRWIPLQHSLIPEQQQQIRLAHDALRNLGLNQLLRNVRGSQFVGLRHVGEGLCQVDEGLAAVGVVEEEDGEVWALGLGVGVGGGDGWFVGGYVGGAEAEGWFEGGGAVVGC